MAAERQLAIALRLGARRRHLAQQLFAARQPRRFFEPAIGGDAIARGDGDRRAARVHPRDALGRAIADGLVEQRQPRLRHRGQRAERATQPLHLGLAGRAEPRRALRCFALRRGQRIGEGRSRLLRSTLFVHALQSVARTVVDSPSTSSASCSSRDAAHRRKSLFGEFAERCFPIAASPSREAVTLASYLAKRTDCPRNLLVVVVRGFLRGSCCITAGGARRRGRRLASDELLGVERVAGFVEGVAARRAWSVRPADSCAGGQLPHRRLARRRHRLGAGALQPR